MKTAPVRPAPLEFDAAGVPRSPLYGDVYHPRAGALGQARHVFLGGNGLPARWRARADFVVLETGFGLGHNFLATRDAWRGDAARCERLHYIAVEQHPLSRTDLARVHRDSPLATLADELHAQWPPLVPGLHRLAFDGGRVCLLLALGDVRAVLPEIVAAVDAFYLDGFAPARNPAMWEPRVFKSMARLAAPGATTATWCVAREVRDGLAGAGFAVAKAAGFGAKREMTVARFAPRFVAPPPPGRARGTRPAHVLVVGGGLAGCAAARALAEVGVASTVFDRRPLPALETSGNPAGIFHGVVTTDDGSHARFHRAAALQAAQAVDAACRAHGVRGAADGLLRLAEAPGTAASLQAPLDALGLPADYVRALDAAEASTLAGVPVGAPALCFAAGGWVEPSALARALLADSGAEWRGDTEIALLRPAGDAWELLDRDGRALARAPVVVLAAHLDTARWLDPRIAPPVERVRGQLSGVPAGLVAAPSRPVAGFGYVLPALDGRVWCGATADAGDGEPALRERDHAHNLAQLARLLGRGVDAPAAALAGRVGWRAVAADRLPWLGAVPDAEALAGTRRLDQPRFVPRTPGLFALTALGSRGIPAALLGARTVAASIAGTPCPLEASLLDAVDAARFVARAMRLSRS